MVKIYRKRCPLHNCRDDWLILLVSTQYCIVFRAACNVFLNLCDKKQNKRNGKNYVIGNFGRSVFPIETIQMSTDDDTNCWQIQMFLVKDCVLLCLQAEFAVLIGYLFRYFSQQLSEKPEHSLSQVMMTNNAKTKLNILSTMTKDAWYPKLEYLDTHPDSWKFLSKHRILICLSLHI